MSPVAGSAAETGGAAPPEAPLHRAIVVAVLPRRPDEEHADDDQRYGEQHDQQDLGKGAHEVGMPTLGAC